MTDAPARLAYPYAIVDPDGRIVELLNTARPPGDGWGHTRELVELRHPHRVGDWVDYGPSGVENEE